MRKKGPPTMVVVKKEMNIPELPDLGDLTEVLDRPSSSNFDQNSFLSSVMQEENSSIDEALKNLLSQANGLKEIEENKNQEEFNFDIALPEISPPPKPIQNAKRIRKNKNYSYRPEYNDIFPGIQRSKKGPEFYYCTICDMDFILGRNGPRAIRQHVKSKKHVLIEKEKENLESGQPSVVETEMALKEIKKLKKSSTNNASYALYRQEYGDQFHGITESTRGSHYFYCTFCAKDLLFGKDGVKAIQRHVTSQKHMQRDDRPELCASINFKGFSFRQDYITKFPGIKESIKGDSYFFCTVCEKDLMLARSGSKAIGLHLLSAKHMEISKEKESILFAEMSNNTEVVEINCGAVKEEENLHVNIEPKAEA